MAKLVPKLQLQLQYHNFPSRKFGQVGVNIEAI
jgi:hypothetical protein